MTNEKQFINTLESRDVTKLETENTRLKKQLQDVIENIGLLKMCDDCVNDNFEIMAETELILLGMEQQQLAVS